MLPRLAIVVLLAGLAGCGQGPELAPVSGVVTTTDGKPLPNMHVIFSPSVGNKENPKPGRDSRGVTDQEGRFTLTYDGKDEGAVVGEHRVKILPVLEDETDFNPETGSADGVVPDARGIVPVPVRYNEKTELRCTVPPEGTDQANFKLDLRRRN